jgi:hypothetical protein
MYLHLITTSVGLVMAYLDWSNPGHTGEYIVAGLLAGTALAVFSEIAKRTFVKNKGQD